MRLRRAHAADHVLFLNFGGCVIEVRTNSSGLQDVLRDYFETFVTDGPLRHILITVHQATVPDLPCDFLPKEPDPGKTKIKEEYVDLCDGRIVRKRLTGMVFIFGGGEHLAVGPCLENPNQVVNFVNNRYIEWKLNQGCLLGHAAGVVWNGRGLGLAGFSGMGKSTLALLLVSQGASLVSNDRLMIEKTGQGVVMHGVAKQPRINPGTALGNPGLSEIIPLADRELFSSVPEDELWTLEHKYDVSIKEFFGPKRFVLSAPMEGLVILNWEQDMRPCEVREARPGAWMRLLPALMKSTGLFYLPGDGRRESDPSADEYAEALQGCALVEMRGGIDFETAASHAMSFLKTGTWPIHQSST
jgi:HprK-related kinase B